MLVSSDYYPALQRDNCKLIDWPIATLSPVGIRTSDGIEHHLDCIVFATGYDVHLTGPPFAVTGLGGRSLAAEWAGGAQAYKSINVHGYPNLFFMTGPNSGPGHNSLLVYIEGQLDYAVRGITAILGNDLRYLDVREEVQRRHNDSIQRRLTKTTWMSGCRSWYLTKDGFNGSMYPGFRDAVSSPDEGFPLFGLRRWSRRHPRPTSPRRPDADTLTWHPTDHRDPNPAPSPACCTTCGARPSACGASRANTAQFDRDRGIAAFRRGGPPPARHRGVRRVPDRRPGPAGRHHHPQHPGLPRPRTTASAIARRPHRVVQRHPSDPAAPDHLDARPRIHHRARPRNAQRVGGRQEPRRRAGPGNGHRGHLDHRETADHAAGRRAADLSTTRDAFERLLALQVIRVDGKQATVTRPKLIEAFNEIRGYGISTRQAHRPA